MRYNRNQSDRNKKKTKKTPSDRSFPRKIHIGEQIWSWKYDSGVVSIREPNGTVHKKSHAEILGVSESKIWNADRYELRLFDYQVTPARVKEYIEQILMPHSSSGKDA